MKEREVSCMVQKFYEFAHFLSFLEKYFSDVSSIFAHIDGIELSSRVDSLSLDVARLLGYVHFLLDFGLEDEQKKAKG